MAYLDRTDPRSRATAVIGVGAVHALIVAGLIAGLAVNGFHIPQGKILGVNIAPPPPPKKPPPPPANPVPQQTTFTAPTPPLPLPQAGPEALPYDPNAELVPFNPPQPTSTYVPQPTPTPSFAPKGAVPLGNTGNWITTNDYPSGPLRRGDEGLTRYRLVVATTGRVTACEIIDSSGSADLDRETCRLLSKRAQFSPATDQAGAKVVGTFNGSVKWDIPD